MSYADGSSITSKLGSMAVKPIVNAGLTYLGAKLLGLDGNMDNPLLGQMEAPSQLAVGSAVSSLGTQVAHSWILPELGSGNFYDGTSMLLSPALQGLFLLAYSSWSDGRYAAFVGPVELVGLGAGSEIGASYLNDGVIQPWLGN